MKELLEYRQKLIERLAAAAREFRTTCEAVGDSFLSGEGGGWNVHQLAAHTRDVDRQVYGMRLRRTVKEENPEFRNFDADEWMASHYSPDEPLESILDEFTASIAELVRQLRSLPSEAWSRMSRHETQGSGFTAQTWVERGLGHIEEHLASAHVISGKV